jgi:hypothetical protein
MGVLATAGFDRWFLAMPTAIRYSPALRATAAAVSAGLYLLLVALMATAKGVLVGWDFGDRRVAVRWRNALGKFKRGVALAQ